MKSICLIGTSHLAALKYGSALLRPSKAYELDFFGCAGGVFRSASLIDGWLVPDTEPMRQRFRVSAAGRDRIEVGAYDAFAIVGFAGVDSITRVCHECVTVGMALKKGRRLVSPALFAAIAEGQIRSQPGIRMALQLREATKAPVFVLCKPRPGLGIKAVKFRLRRMSEGGDGTIIQGVYREVVARLASDGLIVLDQPAQTIAEDVFTDEMYSVGSKRLASAEEHGEEDHSHMNPEYGALVLEALLGELGIAAERVAVETKMAV
jgi:hypothetical protein